MTGGAPEAGIAGETRAPTEHGSFRAAAHGNPDDVPHDADSSPEPGSIAASLSLDDLAVLEKDFDGVDAALQRLADGSYWTDEITGEPLAADVLETDPIARQA